MFVSVREHINVGRVDNVVLVVRKISNYIYTVYYNFRCRLL